MVVVLVVVVVVAITLCLRFRVDAPANLASPGKRETPGRNIVHKPCQQPSSRFGGLI